MAGKVLGTGLAFPGSICTLGPHYLAAVVGEVTRKFHTDPPIVVPASLAAPTPACREPHSVRMGVSPSMRLLSFRARAAFPPWGQAATSKLLRRSAPCRVPAESPLDQVPQGRSDWGWRGGAGGR